VLAERLVEQTSGGRLGSGRKGDLDPAVAKNPRPAPRRLLARILRGDDDAPNPRLENRLHTGRLAPLMRAGLQRHVHRRPRWILAPLPAILKRSALSMQSAKFGVVPLADHLPIPHHDRTDEGIRTNPPATALSQLQRPSEVPLIHACDLAVHRID
jgi:hypothetical protein